ncbi:MAG: IS630 family transposase [Bryobacteraceae bacterium]|nr:IS630 family transposase [Bryobacteraceae bacterium]
MARRDARALDHKTLEEMRIRAVEAVQTGQRVEDVAATMRLSRSTVFGWMALYRAGGWHALKAKPVPGRPPKVTGPQIEWIYKTIAGKTPLQYRFEFALWTLDLVRWLIAERFGIRLSKTSTWRLMNQMGLSAQRPLWRAMEQDAAAVERWKREEYPRIRALAKAAKASIWFGDEAGIRSDYHRGTTWAPVGETPVVATTGARYRWNMISAVNGRGDMRFMLTGKAVTAAVFVEFLRRLITGAAHPVFLIVDGHPTHRSSVVRQFVKNHESRLQLFYLPPYSPELNPDEQVWREVKAHSAGRKRVAGKDEFKRILLAALHRLQKMPHKIRAFFRTPDTGYSVSE